jgi:hypothetical protein
VLSAIIVAAVSRTDVLPGADAQGEEQPEAEDSRDCSVLDHPLVRQAQARGAAALLFVIDEGSMVDLGCRVATIVMRDCERWRVVIAGDVGQLEPVGRGSASGEPSTSWARRASSPRTSVTGRRSRRCSDAGVNPQWARARHQWSTMPTLGSDKAVWDEMRDAS